MKMTTLKEYDLRIPLKQVRNCEVDLGYEKGMLFAYSSSQNCDPCPVLLGHWDSPMHLAMYSENGNQMWHRELGLGLVPGVWFMPFIAFDLDGDGVDEIWFVNNPTNLPFASPRMVLERLDSRTGKTTGVYHFPAENIMGYELGEAFRFMIYGGYVHGKPVLVTQQGTYDKMYLQAYNPDMTLRWERVIMPDEGPRASHSSPILDIDQDGIDEVLVGEHAVSLDDGHDVFCCDRDSFFGHSDVVLPFHDFKTGKGYLFTCRENGNYEGCPRVVMFDYKGNRIWADVYTDPEDFSSGHIHGGFVITAKPDYRRVAVAVHENDTSWAYDAVTGERVTLPFQPRRYHRPIDINGDGYHEYLGWEEGKPTTTVMDSNGQIVYYTGGVLIQIGKWLNFPGEQFLVYYPEEQKVRMWGDAEAENSTFFMKRHADGFHQFMNKMTGCGYNWLMSIDCEG